MTSRSLDMGPVESLTLEDSQLRILPRLCFSDINSKKGDTPCLYVAQLPVPARSNSKIRFHSSTVVFTSYAVALLLHSVRTLLS